MGFRIKVFKTRIRILKNRVSIRLIFVLLFSSFFVFLQHFEYFFFTPVRPSRRRVRRGRIFARTSVMRSPNGVRPMRLKIFSRPRETVTKIRLRSRHDAAVSPQQLLAKASVSLLLLSSSSVFFSLLFFTRSQEVLPIVRGVGNRRNILTERLEK